MTIIVFLIDTSASMNQRTYIGARPTLLDVAKDAVENFVKLRQRNPESRFDRYMLFTSEEPPNHIKAGWKENLGAFMNELKNIRAYGLSTIGTAIKNVFDVLNINRMQSGIDTYGSGRSPFFLEPSMIVCITDGGKLSSSQGVQDDIFPLPKSNSVVGADLTREIFRWDQRLFALVLRLTGTPTPETMGIVPSDNSPLDKLCEHTGGRSYAVRTHRMFQQCIDSLVQKVQSGVVINFEKTGPDPSPIPESKDGPDIVEIDKENLQINSEPLANPMFTHPNSPGSILSPNNTSSSSPWMGSGSPGPPLSPIQVSTGVPQIASLPLLNSNNVNANTTAWHNCRKMIYVPRPPHRGGHGCFWPIPESYYPDSSLPALPIRSAHPNLKFSCASQEPMVIDNLPFDKYELEPSPLTQYILSRKQPTVCWQVFISNSSKNSDVGHPFGYLKASTTKPCVNLFVMPYNYPILLPLLDDLFKTHRLKPTKEWRMQFDNYLKSMPNYYISPLKRALERMGVSNLIPDKFDNSLSIAVVNNLKKLKNKAKLEYEKICAEVEKRINSSGNGISSSGNTEGIRVHSRKLHNHLTSNHLLRDKILHLRDQVTEYNFIIPVKEAEVQPQLYRNPFDISRTQLIDQLIRMRANFLQRSLANLLVDKGQDQLHCKPISQMGNYQDYLRMNKPLREIESAPVRQHMFGNPFKIDKRMSMMVDEADVDLMGGAGNAGQAGAGGGRGTKRPSESPIGGPLNKGKRRKGPLSPDFNLERYLSSPPPSRPSTPILSRIEERPDSPLLCPHSPPMPPKPINAPPAPRIQEAPPVVHPSVTTPPPPPLRQEVPIPIGPPQANPPPLLPSPAAIAPYLSQLSPPGSPASPYATEDMPAYSGGSLPYSIANGDFSSYFSESIDNPRYEPKAEESSPVAPTYGTYGDGLGTGGNDFKKEYSNSRNDRSSSPYSPVDERNGIVSKFELEKQENELLINGSDTPQTNQFNRQLVLKCYKEVKKPGRDFRNLLEKLDLVQGSAETRTKFVENILKEAARFKRHSLISTLSQHFKIAFNGNNSHQHVSRRAETRNNSHLLNGHNR